MTRFDQVLTKLTIVCFAIWVVIVGYKLICDWSAIRMLTFADESLKGKKSDVLFERVPILPDRIIFDSAIPNTVVYEYLDGQYGLLRYPKVNIVVTDGVIEEAFRVE